MFSNSNTSVAIESLTNGIDRMLAEADDVPADGGLSVTAEPLVPTVNRQSLLTVHGWPKRYVDPIELEGDEWKLTFANAMPYVERGGIVIFHGTRGPGKTRMAAEIARSGRFPADVVKGKGAAGIPQDPKRTALYRTAMEFFVEVRSSYRKNSETSEKAIIDRLAGAGLLVLDELQERGESPFEDRLLTHLIDRRYGAMLPTILIANYTREEFTQALGASAIDRFRECGKRFEFTWESYRRTGR
ncbi:MAG TPA: hypothetical protein VGE67_11650 [Haloferula sp.]